MKERFPEHPISFPGDLSVVLTLKFAYNFYTYDNERPQHAELYKNYMEDYAMGFQFDGCSHVTQKNYPECKQAYLSDFLVEGILDRTLTIKFCLWFYEDFHTYSDERLRHAELYKNYTEDCGYLK
uniref:Uncharacterized protein n=1 Tax=Romanomermis culicivorax TaxID=13658 RepID=A0A915IS40_ROMCU